MGVRACYRPKCRNIMCDVLFVGVEKYICSDCLEELRAFRKTWPREMFVGEVREKVRAFMCTEPGTYAVLGEDEIEREFKRIVGDRKE